MNELGNLNAREIVYFKYAPITSKDDEWNFLQYKNLLIDNWCSLFENIKEKKNLLVIKN